MMHRNVDKPTLEYSKQYIPSDLPADRCWPWKGTVLKHGYGQVKHKGKKYRAHRISYEAFKGSIPEGFIVCHACDNPPCVNPNHLFLGDIKANSVDAKNKNRHAHGERHGMRKLNDHSVMEIFKRKNSGVPGWEVGKEFGVSENAVLRIWRKEQWFHLKKDMEEWEAENG